MDIDIMDNMDLTMTGREFDDEDQQYLVSHVLQNGKIVCLSDPIIGKLERELESLKFNPGDYQPPRIDEILHKKMLLAPFGVSYYRAKYYGPSPESKPSHVSVHFVDYGNIEDIPLSALVLAKHVSPDLEIWPTLGFSVFVPEISKITPKKFLNLFHNEKVTITKDDKTGRVTLFLDKFGKEDNKLNINQFVLNYCTSSD